MVWGMMMPSGFGDFWPMGEPEGVIRLDKPFEDLWNARLKDHYIAQTSEGRRALIDIDEESNGSYAYFVSSKFNDELGTRPEPDLPPLTPIKPHEVPQFYQTQKGYKTLGSYIELSGLSCAVDETLKNIIERLEPGVHQFFPIEIRMTRGKIYPSQYYILVIGQYFDSFSPEESKKGSLSDYGPDYPNEYKPPHSKADVTGRALSKAKFGKAHLWRERRIRGLLTCLSDELVAAIAEAGLRIPKHYKMMEV